MICRAWTTTTSAGAAPPPTAHSMSPLPPGSAFCSCRSRPDCWRSPPASLATRLRTGPDGGGALPGRRNRRDGRGPMARSRGGGPALELPDLIRVHRGKTGALIRAACTLGGLAAQAGTAELEALTAYGEDIGLAFQIADDVLDATGTSEELGKTAGRESSWKSPPTWSSGDRRGAAGGAAAGSERGGPSRARPASPRALGGLGRVYCEQNRLMDCSCLVCSTITAPRTSSASAETSFPSWPRRSATASSSAARSPAVTSAPASAWSS